MRDARDSTRGNKSSRATDTSQEQDNNANQEDSSKTGQELCSVIQKTQRPSGFIACRDPGTAGKGEAYEQEKKIVWDR